MSQSAKSISKQTRIFFRGVSRTLDLAGLAHTQTFLKDDYSALAKDWTVVGRDLYKSVASFEKQRPKLRA